MSQMTDGPVNPRPSQPPSPTAVPPLHAPRPDVLGTIGPAAELATPKPPTQLSREQILDATELCLRDLGYDGTTIRRIAKQLDCAVGSIYRYFSDKRDLLAVVVQRRFEPVLDRIDANAPTDAVSNLYAQIAADQPELYRLMFWLASVGQTTHTNTLPAVVRRIIDAWAQRFGDRRVAESYWSHVHGAIMQGRRVDDLPLPPASDPLRTPAAPPAVPPRPEA